jgi:hypothetical protein
MRQLLPVVIGIHPQSRRFLLANPLVSIPMKATIIETPAASPKVILARDLGSRQATISARSWSCLRYDVITKRVTLLQRLVF